MTDIWSPDLYVQGPPHERFTELRRTDPVHWVDIPGQAGYWAVLRHADVVTVARQPQIFSASTGGVILEDPTDEALASMRRMLLAMDPPAHGDLRRPVSVRFRNRVIATMEDSVRSVCMSVVAEALERGSVEFVGEVAAKVPSRVFGRIMGVPEEDVDHLHHLAEQITSVQEPELEYRGPYPSPAIEMAAYAMEFAARGPSDLAAMLVEQLDGPTFASFFVQLVTAGNDTTKTLLTAGLLRLLSDGRDSLAALRADPGGWPDAVEEMLRFDNPIHYFRRTATAPVVLAGREIAEGDKVAMVYTSANRDEEVFDRPSSFETRRRPNPHLAFGIGEHFCLGAHLARLEARVFFTELFSRASKVELAGDPVRIRSNLNNAYKRAPVVLRA